MMSLKLTNEALIATVANVPTFLFRTLSDG